MSQGVKATLEAVFRKDCGRLVAAVAGEGPLELRGPFAQRGAPLFYLRNTTCGILGADRYRVRIEALDGAAVQVSSSSAAKAYNARGLVCETRVEIEARPGSEIVWGPHPLILQEGSNLRQRLTCTIHSGATVRLAEVLCFGRAACGEDLAFEAYDFELGVRRYGKDEASYEERYALRPAANVRASLVGHAALATVYVFGDGTDTNERMREALRKAPGMGGCSSLANGIGYVAKGLTRSVSEGLAFCETLLSALSPNDPPRLEA